MHADGHARVYYGTRIVQKTHVARLKFPAPATMETWVTDRDGDPVFMVVAEPSDSLAGELRRLLQDLRQVVGQGRQVTVCFDRGGWSPALFADITAAGFDLLTWRKGPAPDLPAAQFTTITCTDDRGREHEYDLADTTITLTISEGPRKGQTVSLRQVTRRVLARGCPNPAKKAAAAQIRHTEVLAAAAEAQRDTSLAALCNPPPGQPVTITNQMINALDAPVEAAHRELEAAQDAAAGQLLIRLDPLTAPRRTQALAALCDQLSQAQACYPGTELILHYEIKSHPSPA